MLELKRDPVYPTRFYRTPDAISEDIRAVSVRIAAINDSLNTRELVAELLWNDEEKLIMSCATLAELMDHAEEALRELSDLNSVLDELKAELIESIEKCK